MAAHTVNLVRPVSLALLALGTAGCGVTWQDRLAGRLPLLGHRNWIVIADSAYPQQSNPGIETISAAASHVDAVRTVLKLVDAAAHVRPAVYVDHELAAVSERDAPGIDVYRAQLKEVLGDRPVQTLAHADIIARLDEAAKLFNVLIIKTDLTLPYTSVFVELECGYWDAAAERRLRETLDTQ
jgi:hypothetical protein